MKFHISIDIENDAFKYDGLHKNDHDCRAEITRVLEQAIKELNIECPPIDRKLNIRLHDSNGNHVGNATVKTR